MAAHHVCREQGHPEGGAVALFIALLFLVAEHPEKSSRQPSGVDDLTEMASVGVQREDCGSGSVIAPSAGEVAAKGDL
jgi:hypothetical protein